MNLSDIVIERKPVETSGGTFTVRGLSLKDILTLYREHEREVVEIYSTLSGNTQEPVTDEGINALVGSAVDMAPMVAARIIAMAAEEGTPEQIEAASNLPVPVTMDALFKIGELTFRSDADVKKTFAVLTNAIRKSTYLLQGK